MTPKQVRPAGMNDDSVESSQPGGVAFLDAGTVRHPPEIRQPEQEVDWSDRIGALRLLVSCTRSWCEDVGRPFVPSFPWCPTCSGERLRYDQAATADFVVARVLEAYDFMPESYGRLVDEE